MLSRTTPRVSGLIQHQRCFASNSAYDAFSGRMQQLKSSYPTLFDRSAFMSEQESLLASYRSSLPSLLSEYDSARQSVDAATGEPVFQTLSEEGLLSDLSGRNQPFFNSLAVGQEEDISGKLLAGKEYVDAIIRLQSEQSAAGDIKEQNLKMIDIASYGDKLEEWHLRFPDPLNDSSDLGLPISDEEADEWVRQEYHHAPDSVRAQETGVTYAQHKDIEEEWMQTLDDKLLATLKSRDANFDEARFREFCSVTNEMFHPHAIDHYGMSNYAKGLFRAAFWQNKERCAKVEESIFTLQTMIKDARDDDAAILRGVYEAAPDTRYAQLAAFQLKLTDPLFAAKLVEALRTRLEEAVIIRAQKDVVYDLEVPSLQAERAEVETELRESQSSNPVNMVREIANLKAAEAAFAIEPPSLEAVLDELLPSKLWNRDAAGVKTALSQYASGSGSLKAVSAAIDAALGADANADSGALSDSEILDLSVKYHNSRHADVARFSFRDFLNQSVLKKDLASVLLNRRQVRRQLGEGGAGMDSLVVNLVRILMEDNAATDLEKVCGDYLDIMKRFRGEIEGLVTSATEMDDGTFAQIKGAIEAANPGKKITLERSVDSGLSSGFIVKAGVQRFDFSMATVIHEGRTKVGAI